MMTIVAQLLSFVKREREDWGDGEESTGEVVD